jgi:hypothetical protein
MDIEGSEYSVFENASDSVYERIDYMVIEVHPTKEKGPDDLRAILESKGFKVIDRAYGNGCYDFFCVKETI